MSVVGCPSITEVLKSWSESGESWYGCGVGAQETQREEGEMPLCSAWTKEVCQGGSWCSSASCWEGEKQQSRPPLKGTPWKDKRQHPQAAEKEPSLRYKENIFLWDSSDTGPGPQASCGVFTPGDVHPEWDWTRLEEPAWTLKLGLSSRNPFQPALCCE